MRDFKQYFIIPASPQDLYKALTNPATIQLWTGEPAVMNTMPGHEFSLWDGSIVGKNIAFEEGKRIEQEWYFGEQEQLSIVTIKLHDHKRGTSVELTHTNIPEHDYEHIVTGWRDNYLASLEDFYLDN